MGNPFFSWYPHQMYTSVDYFKKIDLSEDLTDLQVTPKRDVADAFSLAGGRSRELLRPWLEIRIVYDRFTSRLLFRRFSAMINHLERGGMISFGVDSDKVYSSRVESALNPAMNSMTLGPNISTAKYDTVCAHLAVDDEFVLETGAPLARREYGLVHAISGHTPGDPTTGCRITKGDGSAALTVEDYYPAGAHVRHSDFYPTLIMAPGDVGGAHLTHDHRITYTLDLKLIYVIPFNNNRDDQSTNGGDQPDSAN